MKDVLDTHLQTARGREPRTQIVDVEFTDGQHEQCPLRVDNTMPKGWMLVEYTDGTASVHFATVLRGKLCRTWFRGHWRIQGTRITADTPQELVRHIARTIKL